ncbi:MAG: hypothetical protein ACOYXR_09305 [Nitrospirota bacterium]
MEGAFSRAGGGVAALGKAAALGAAGIAVGAGALAKGFVDAAIESQKVTAQTDAVIKSMGNAANTTAGQVAKLSTKLSLKSGIDDELIQSGSNVLLTFGKIRNEAGKGNDIFDQATASALDMSVALGTDMKSASMLVGKALNDPIRGLTQLRRSGVQFTKQQEDQIKAMVEVGDVAGAQKVMLAELKKQFGGSAAAQATATDKLKVAWGNLQEQLGAKLLPIVEKVATWLAASLPGAMAQAEAAFNRVRPVIEQLIATVQEKWPQIQATIMTVVESVRVVIEGFVSIVTTLWDNFGNNILSFVERVWPAVQQVISGVMDTIQGIIKTVSALIKGDWSAVWDGIKQIVRGVWEAIQGIVKTAFEGLRLAIGGALEVIGSLIRGAWDGIVGFVAGLPARIKTAASGLFDGIKAAFKSAINWIIRAWNKLEFKIPGFDPPGPGPKFGGFTLGVPDITPLAKGGIVTRPTLALMGEAGPEAVIPLNRAGGMGGQTIVVQIGDEVVARVVANALARGGRRGVA